MRLEVASSGSRKMPPRNGRKNRSMIFPGESVLAQGGEGRDFRCAEHLIDFRGQNLSPQLRDQQLVVECADWSKRRGQNLSRPADGIRNRVKLAVIPHDRARFELAKIERTEIQAAPRFRISRQQDLEATVQQESHRLRRCGRGHRCHPRLPPLEPTGRGAAVQLPRPSRTRRLPPR